MKKPLLIALVAGAGLAVIGGGIAVNAATLSATPAGSIGNAPGIVLPSGSTDDDGTADQGSGDAPGTPGSADPSNIPSPSPSPSPSNSTDDDGTPDQGSGDAPGTPGSSDDHGGDRDRSGDDDSDDSGSGHGGDDSGDDSSGHGGGRDD